MSHQLQSDLHQIIENMELPEQVTLEAASAFLGDYIITPQATEHIYVTLNEDGTPAEGKTVKPSNLKFNQGKLLWELGEKGTTLLEGIESPLTMLLLGLDFLRNMKEFATLEIGAQEANLLLMIYRFTVERDMITIDHLKAAVGSDLSDVQFIESLEKLEQLSCLTLNKNRFVLQETITFHRN